MPTLGAYIARTSATWLAPYADQPPWIIVRDAAELIGARVASLDGAYRIADGVAIHRDATIEAGAVIKPPAIVAAGCFIAAHTYLRGGVWLDEGCRLGPGVEVKSSFLFQGTALAHFNFVGDSCLGSLVNLEAGAILANHRNELADPKIIVRVGGKTISTQVTKFGALLGDGVRIGANAVLAPGTLLPPGRVVPRLSLVDQG